MTWISGSLIHSSEQIAPNKCQAYRINVLSLTSCFLLIVDITLLCRIQSDSDTDSDENARYQDIIIVSCWNINNNINFPSWLESSLSLDYLKRYKVVLSRGWGWGAYFQNSKVILKIWQILKKIVQD